MEVHGFFDDKFAQVVEQFEKNFAERGDIGGSFALTVEGEYVIDIWGGHMDADLNRAWQSDTIVNVYSTSKTMTFISALLLADQGRLDLDAPVANYWPEFGQKGKADIPVKYLLSHSAGLPAFDPVLSTEQLYDWDAAIHNLENQEPWWEPGSASGYHAVTQGFLIGEVIRRITGKSYGTFFKEEVADVVGADFHIGLDPKDFSRIADLIPTGERGPIMKMDADSITHRVFSSTDLAYDATRTEAWRRAEIPAINGHGNARSVVRAQTAMANGGKAFGSQLLSEAGCKRALEQQISGPDKVLIMPLTFAMGYALNSKLIKVGPNPNTLWWAGLGGSMIIIDTDAHLCFSYVMNQVKSAMIGDERASSLGKAVYQGLAA